MEKKSPSEEELSLDARARSKDISYILLFSAILGFLAYVWCVGRAYMSDDPDYNKFKEVMMGRESLLIGIPASAVFSYVIITLLLHSFPPNKDQNGQITFKFIGLEFSGPAGPITLWLACFLAFVGSISSLSSCA